MLEADCPWEILSVISLPLMLGSCLAHFEPCLASLAAFLGVMVLPSSLSPWPGAGELFLCSLALNSLPSALFSELSSFLIKRCYEAKSRSILLCKGDGGNMDAVDRTLDKEIGGWQVKTTGHDVLGADMSENRPSKNSFCESISELKYSDDFTSPCYSEDFHTTEGTSRSLISLQAPDSSSGAENPKHGSDTKLELKDLDSSTSDHFGEDDDDIGPLSISKQCKDISESYSVIQKFGGRTLEVIIQETNLFGPLLNQEMNPDQNHSDDHSNQFF
ncbi:Putative protein KIAA1383 [Fukomys damarensis]|uniref:Microtubule-associated protein 10 C-terminal domain-containing protein n=1 Tax=Fukomys damarensis TaxID=885580 RepID=A0A091DUU8_FUKDA|nr:Putative protein KIAA1383 [Fukomys damarensis]